MGIKRRASFATKVEETEELVTRTVINKEKHRLADLGPNRTDHEQFIYYHLRDTLRADREAKTFYRKTGGTIRIP